MTKQRLIIVIAWPLSLILDIGIALCGIDTWRNLRAVSNQGYREMWANKETRRIE